MSFRTSVLLNRPKLVLRFPISLISPVPISAPIVRWALSIAMEGLVGFIVLVLVLLPECGNQELHGSISNGWGEVFPLFACFLFGPPFPEITLSLMNEIQSVLYRNDHLVGLEKVDSISSVSAMASENISHHLLLPWIWGLFYRKQYETATHHFAGRGVFVCKMQIMGLFELSTT